MKIMATTCLSALPKPATSLKNRLLGCRQVGDRLFPPLFFFLTTASSGSDLSVYKCLQKWIKELSWVLISAVIRVNWCLTWRRDENYNPYYSCIHAKVQSMRELKIKKIEKWQEHHKKHVIESDQFQVDHCTASETTAGNLNAIKPKRKDRYRRLNIEIAWPLYIWLIATSVLIGFWYSSNASQLLPWVVCKFRLWRLTYSILYSYLLPYYGCVSYR
jgi:hypothetical protein